MEGSNMVRVWVVARRAALTFRANGQVLEEEEDPGLPVFIEQPTCVRGEGAHERARVGVAWQRRDCRRRRVIRGVRLALVVLCLRMLLLLVLRVRRRRVDARVDLRLLRLWLWRRLLRGLRSDLRRVERVIACARVVVDGAGGPGRGGRARLHGRVPQCGVDRARAVIQRRIPVGSRPGVVRDFLSVVSGSTVHLPCAVDRGWICASEGCICGTCSRRLQRRVIPGHCRRRVLLRCRLVAPRGRLIRGPIGDHRREIVMLLDGRLLRRERVGLRVVPWLYVRCHCRCWLTNSKRVKKRRAVFTSGPTCGYCGFAGVDGVGV